MITTSAQRNKVVTLGKWWIANRAYSVYEEFRPVTFFTQTQFEARNASHEDTYFDCSSSADELFWMEGSLGDPSGPAYNFNGYGNTQTQYEFLPHLAGGVKAALPGDLIMFDPPPENLAHVCVVLEADPVNGNPPVFNNGGRGEPVESTYLAEHSVHGGQAVTVLSIANLSKVAPPPLPPVDPHHYQWFDNARIWLPDGGPNSERNVCENATEQLADPKKNAASLKNIYKRLEYLYTRAKNNKAKPGKHPHIDWRIQQIGDRMAHIRRVVPGVN